MLSFNHNLKSYLFFAEKTTNNCLKPASKHPASNATNTVAASTAVGCLEKNQGVRFRSLDT